MIIYRGASFLLGSILLSGGLIVLGQGMQQQNTAATVIGGCLLLFACGLIGNAFKRITG